MSSLYEQVTKEALRSAAASPLSSPRREEQKQLSNLDERLLSFFPSVKAPASPIVPPSPPTPTVISIPPTPKLLSRLHSRTPSVSPFTKLGLEYLEPEEKQPEEEQQQKHEKTQPQAVVVEQTSSPASSTATKVATSSAPQITGVSSLPSSPSSADASAALTTSAKKHPKAAPVSFLHQLAKIIQSPEKREQKTNTQQEQTQTATTAQSPRQPPIQQTTQPATTTTVATLTAANIQKAQAVETAKSTTHPPPSHQHTASNASMLSLAASSNNSPLSPASPATPASSTLPLVQSLPVSPIHRKPPPKHKPIKKQHQRAETQGNNQPTNNKSSAVARARKDKEQKPHSSPPLPDASATAAMQKKTPPPPPPRVVSHPTQATDATVAESSSNSDDDNHNEGDSEDDSMLQNLQKMWKATRKLNKQKAKQQTHTRNATVPIPNESAIPAATPATSQTATAEEKNNGLLLLQSPSVSHNQAQSSASSPQARLGSPPLPPRSTSPAPSSSVHTRSVSSSVNPAHYDVPPFPAAPMAVLPTKTTVVFGRTTAMADNQKQRTATHKKGGLSLFDLAYGDLNEEQLTATLPAAAPQDQPLPVSIQSKLLTPSPGRSTNVVSQGIAAGLPISFKVIPRQTPRFAGADIVPDLTGQTAPPAASSRTRPTIANPTHAPIYSSLTRAAVSFPKAKRPVNQLQTHHTRTQTSPIPTSPSASTTSVTAVNSPAAVAPAPVVKPKKLAKSTMEHLQRLYAAHATKQQHLSLVKQQQEQEELEACSFKPVLAAKTDILAERKRQHDALETQAYLEQPLNSRVSVLQEQYLMNQHKKQQQKEWEEAEKQQKELQECTFAPVLNHHNQHNSNGTSSNHRLTAITTLTEDQQPSSIIATRVESSATVAALQGEEQAPTASSTTTTTTVSTDDQSLDQSSVSTDNSATAYSSTVSPVASSKPAGSYGQQFLKAQQRQQQQEAEVASVDEPSSNHQPKLKKKKKKKTTAKAPKQRAETVVSHLDLPDLSPLLHVDIAISPTRTERMSLRDGDDVYVCAQEFVTLHQLDHAYIPVIQQMLEAACANFFNEQQSNTNSNSNNHNNQEKQSAIK